MAANVNASHRLCHVSICLHIRTNFLVHYPNRVRIPENLGHSLIAHGFFPVFLCCSVLNIANIFEGKQMGKLFVDNE